MNFAGAIRTLKEILVESGQDGDTVFSDRTEETKLAIRIADLYQKQGKLKEAEDILFPYLSLERPINRAVTEPELLSKCAELFELTGQSEKASHYKMLADKLKPHTTDEQDFLRLLVDTSSGSESSFDPDVWQRRAALVKDVPPNKVP